MGRAGEEGQDRDLNGVGAGRGRRRASSTPLPCHSTVMPTTLNASSMKTRTCARHGDTRARLAAWAHSQGTAGQQRKENMRAHARRGTRTHARSRESLLETNSQQRNGTARPNANVMTS
eukprot:3828899-Pleurochrysis_carterae.AAC.3